MGTWDEHLAQLYSVREDFLEKNTRKISRNYVKVKGQEDSILCQENRINKRGQMRKTQNALSEGCWEAVKGETRLYKEALVSHKTSTI